MGWIKRKIDEHACPLPPLPNRITSNPPDIWPGDVWECDGCHLRWVVRENQHDGLYWQQTDWTEKLSSTGG